MKAQGGKQRKTEVLANEKVTQEIHAVTVQITEGEMKHHYGGRGGLISLLWLCWLPHPLRVSLRCRLLCLEQGLFASRLELMIRMMREKVFAATLALKLVDHSLRHCPENCSLIGRQLRHAVEGARCDFPQT